MRCIFCKRDSSNSRSKEHIIPESLGNDEHVLPPKVVCDTCNNYFARKIEGPLLNTEYFRQLRSRQRVKNKRGRIPSIRATFPGLAMTTNVWIDAASIQFSADTEAELQNLEMGVLNGTTKRLLVPIASKLDRHLMSRFLGKIALEVLAQKFMHFPDWESAVIDKPEIDALRDYVRRGSEPHEWPYYDRTLHFEDQPHHEEEQAYQVLHEYTLLYTKENLLFLILSLFGHEFAISFTTPSVLEYENWLSKNNGKSPLYPNGEYPIGEPPGA